ncbi:MFS transporter [Oceanirhabdus sp. W0125-5]|uniref:MFS transporter n=1 Tax=Oceanirhabdus sp. W0125-5 TaxID=2999116 RepID=UPI0022F2F8E4|nr:MFS transporter [Oceanirhabdus sp. W0125-5]WBW96728.1 MFS transporter [Oceanirhabdus sp. W0125-5]
MKKSLGINKAVYYISFPLAFIGFILPIYAASMGSSVMEVGLLYSVFSLCSVLIRPLVGKLIDTKGRKSCFIIGLFCYVVVSALFLVGNTYKYILAARVVQSIASAFLWISINTMISDVSVDSRRAYNFAIVGENSSKGAMMGSLIGFGIMFSYQGDDKFIYIFGVYFIVAILALFTGIKNCRETINDCPVVSENNSVIINSRFIKFLLITMILSTVTSLLAPIFLIYIRDNITKSMTQISYLYIPASILSMMLPSKLAKFTDKHKKYKIMIVGIMIDAVFTLIIPVFKTFEAFMIIYTITCIGGMLSGPAQKALVSEMTGGNQRGKAYGLYSFAVGIGGIIGPLAGTAIYQYVSSDMAFYLQGAVLIICCILIGMLFSINRKKGTDVVSDLKMDEIV